MYFSTTGIFSLLIHATLILGGQIEVKHSGRLEEGHELTLICIQNSTEGAGNFSWWRDDKAIAISSRELNKHTKVLTFSKLGVTDISNYTCKAPPSTSTASGSSNASQTFEVVFQVPVRLEAEETVTVAEGNDTKLQCHGSGYPLDDKLQWEHHHVARTVSDSIVTSRNATHIVSTLILKGVTRTHNGLYVCKYEDVSTNTTLKVTSLPEVKSFNLHVIGKSRIFVDWVIWDGNLQLQTLTLSYQTVSSKHINKINDVRKLAVGSHIIRGLSPNTDYSHFSLEVKNSAGSAKMYINQTSRTFHEDVQFVPTPSVNGLTPDTITLGWNVPPNLSSLYHYFKIFVKAWSGGASREYTATETPVLIENLQPGTNYSFVVQACSNYTRTCDKPSAEINGTTMDGKPSAPTNVQVVCHLDQITNEGIVHVSWDTPAEPRGSILEYAAILTGNSTYAGEDGQQIIEGIGPHSRTVRTQRIDFLGQLPNTYVYVSVCAKTRIRLCGPPAGASCSIPSSIPHQEELSKASWKTVYQKDNFYFLVTIPHISHRNGSICCLRVIVVRLTNSSSLDSLQPPPLVKLQSYSEVHSSALGGAYVAELLEPESKIHNIMIGDGQPAPDKKVVSCPKCSRQKRNIATKRAREAFAHMLYHPEHNKGKRHFRSPSVDALQPLQHPDMIEAIHDGPLDSESTYTAYLEAIILNERNEPVKAQSKYFAPLKRSADNGASGNENNGEQFSEYQVLGGSILLGSLVIILSMVFVSIVCLARVRKQRRTRGLGLSHSIQYWCNRIRGQRGLHCTVPESIPPIWKADLMMGFLDRHQDCDYGFQQEFEMLPDRFVDRTYFESDRRENASKNRYPDIKAFDQTRVVLNIQNDVASSDYINANYVNGYKDRKKYICSQGPMDSTINDWWRMIWEQQISLVLMLTNIEEYSKTKCAKYWPSEGAGTYGDIVVSDCNENKCSVEYTIRRLKIKNAAQENEREREVVQLHYLVWKDFMAPEHPMGIIRFIKKFNEMYCPDSETSSPVVTTRPPILVHCSAGVGRTGTLVALDILLAELEETGAVTIFNTICDLRHQRNYLVQSLKQYIFIYRALMEAVQFGDTQIRIADLKGVVETHTATIAKNGKSSIQLEFEKLSQVIEDRKPFLVGAGEENRHRNRHENVIPYDKSRVILSPIPNANKEVCTYINASFIDGYDSSDQFIITQDPLEATVGDFWRMIVEQNIRTIIMLSEVGEDTCPRYWPEKDQETSHGSIRVKYMQSQSFPFYYRREFTITNSRTQDAFLVTQFQYNGWPVGIDQVPESARGLVELIDTTFKHKDNLETLRPKVVHCSAGADRSCIYVALAILVQQMLSESTVDVFNVVRSLRAQRQGLFQNFAQYELVYRGLLTYSELHRSNGEV